MNNKSTVGGSIVRALLFVIAFTFLTGFVYTVVITGIGQTLFPKQANGSVIEINGKTYGTELLGQQFSEPGHLWGRLMNLDVSSFKNENGEPAMYSTPINKSPAGAEVDEMVKARVAQLKAADPTMEGVPIPVDLVTVAGSGLDPEISPAAAEYQVHRIATARGISEDEVRKVIAANTKGRLFGLFGNPRVHVLKVNLMLDGILTEGK